MKLKRISLTELSMQTTQHSFSIDRTTLDEAQVIIDQVRQHKDQALRSLAQRFGEIGRQDEHESLFIEQRELVRAMEDVDTDVIETLHRTAARIEAFAKQQLSCFSELDFPIDGGRAGHRLIPIEKAGCYVPGGRYPLVSTALMTAVTARTAGCGFVVMATPKPNATMLAAAAIANVDGVLRVGGAHAIAAFAYGTESIQPVDLIVGPGNRWVTAAKQLVAGDVGIDMLAGPTELVILADSSANPAKVAADLLAQAEHDEDARPLLVTIDDSVVDRVEEQLALQLDRIATAETARISLSTNGFAVICQSLEKAIEACNLLAPEHLELMCEQPELVGRQINHAGCLFWGDNCGEVFGDYGVGPNHTLPTARTARFSAGLNVMNFIRIRSFIEMNQQPSDQLFDDVSRLAQLEGLAAHRAACEIRRSPSVLHSTHPKE